MATSDRIIWNFSGNYRFLSNFYPCKVRYEGLWYPTAENAYQASKTLVPSLRREFQHLAPGQAKALGKTVPLRPFWENMKLAVMAEIVNYKFRHDSGMQKLLTDTYPKKLIEGNTWGDTYWGMIYDPSQQKWIGENHLGKILMAVRDKILHWEDR